MAWRSHYVGHLRAVNNNLLDTYQLKSQNALLDGTVERIERRRRRLPRHRQLRARRRGHEGPALRPRDRVHRLPVRRRRSSTATAGPELVINDRFPAQTPEWESANVPGLYFAGTLMQVRDFKKSTSGFIHGFRYGVRALHRMLERQYHGVRLAARRAAGRPRRR